LHESRGLKKTTIAEASIRVKQSSYARTEFYSENMFPRRMDTVILSRRGRGRGQSHKKRN
jgi:hypothetical protein